jgi:hypothetical protein
MAMRFFPSGTFPAFAGGDEGLFKDKVAILSLPSEGNIGQLVRPFIEHNANKIIL